MYLFKKVREYLTDDYTDMDYYTKGESIIFKVAFVFLIICQVISWMILYALIFLTAPIWVVPYALFKKEKRK